MNAKSGSLSIPTSAKLAHRGSDNKGNKHMTACHTQAVEGDGSDPAPGLKTNWAGRIP